MALKNVIRKGDTTTHGGTVIEGISNYLVLEKEIACKGHMVACPLCKGGFPIVEGILTPTVEGRHPAVDGMKTACGAALIASQISYKLDDKNRV